MTIKLNHECEAGRHCFIPTRWEEDVKIQQRWVTEFSCQHCLYYVSTERWLSHIDEITPKQQDKAINDINQTIPGEVYNLLPDDICTGNDEKITTIVSAASSANYIVNEKLSSISKTESKPEKKRGRPFTKDKK
jgi:hypothetical protein